MMTVKNDFYIRCNNCGYVTTVNADSLEYDTHVYDRPMGEEIEYNFYGEICCEKCHNWISFNIRAYEYPVGAFNFSDNDCHGGEFVEQPTVEIEYEFDDYYDDYAYNQYIQIEELLEYHRNQIKEMSSREFEFFVAELFEKLGYSVKVTKATRDGGQDIIATKKGPIPFTLIVECKHWGANHKVDVSVVRSVYGVQTAMQANKSVVVTSSKFTKDARKFAEERQELMTLTALSGEEDQIKGLDLQVDDYITKPFSMPVLLRKIAAVLRRSNRGTDEKYQIITYGNLLLNCDSYIATVDGANFELTQKEFEILRELLTHQGRILTRQNLLDKLWRYDFYGDERVVDTHIKNLRKKLGIDFIQTIRGVGYKVDKEN